MLSALGMFGFLLGSSTVLGMTSSSVSVAGGDQKGGGREGHQEENVWELTGHEWEQRTSLLESCRGYGIPRENSGLRILGGVVLNMGLRWEREGELGRGRSRDVGKRADEQSPGIMND